MLGKRWRYIVLACSASALAWVWWYDRVTAGEALSSAQPAAVATAADAPQSHAGAEPPSQAQRRQSAPSAVTTDPNLPANLAHQIGEAAPAFDAPIASYFEEEARRAQNGNRRSACRLGFDLSLCSRIDKIRTTEEYFLRQAEQTSAEELTPPRSGAIIIEHLGRARENILRAETICGGLTAEQQAMAWKFLTRAAELGDHNAAAYFVFAPPLSKTDFLNDFEGWTYYMNNYERLLARAVAAGNPQALFLSQRFAMGLPPISAFNPSGNTRQVPKDLIRGLTYSLVLERISDLGNARDFRTQTDHARSMLTAAQIGQATEAADAMYKGLFKQQFNLDFGSGPTRDFDAKKCYAN